MVEASEARLLPILKVDGIEYLVDIERWEFRQFNDPSNVINMHSKLGRKIVKESLGKQWHSFGLVKPATQSRHDMTAFEQCGNSLAAHT
jgi:hypothetical protein